VKVNQVEEASKFVKVGVDLQISNHIQIVKVDGEPHTGREAAALSFIK